MITLQFFKNFSKNTRSTKTPNLVSNSNKVQFLVLLKEKTSIKNPVFVINSNVNGQTQLNLHLYNYVYWEEIGRFYFISDIIQVNEQIYEVHCINDVLGTCRNIILNRKVKNPIDTGVTRLSTKGSPETGEVPSPARVIKAIPVAHKITPARNRP